MRSLRAADVLHVWEVARDHGPVRRALALLAVAVPDMDAERLSDLSIGERDGLLLQLREQLFGPHLWSLATCPACGEQVELRFTVGDIRVPGAATGADGATIVVGGRDIRFRLPTSRDLLLIADRTDLVGARQILLRRCLLGDAPDSIDATVAAALTDEIARRDPQADVRLALGCPACGHAWEALFDIVSFLWSEIERWAARLLQEVHILASAYGWREADILALSPARRRLYLNLVSR